MYEPFNKTKIFLFYIEDCAILNDEVLEPNNESE